MPGTPTTKLSLYKSASDGSELVDYTQDIGNNLDKIDSAMGFTICTSSTRPSVPYVGQAIYEGDTHRMYVWTSGTWTEIAVPAASPTFTAGLAATQTTPAGIVFAAADDGDAQRRFGIKADGTLQWGTGAATEDTNLYRSAANKLKTDDDFESANYIVTMDWTALSSLGTFQTNFSAHATQIPKMQKIILAGTERWRFKGRVTVSSFTTATSLNVFIFTSATNAVVGEREFGIQASSSNFYPLRLGFFPSTDVTFPKAITVGGPTAVGTGVSGIWLDGVEIDDPSNIK